MGWSVMGWSIAKPGSCSIIHPSIILTKTIQCTIYLQGQIWEAANIAKLQGLPMVFITENNHYGMGTSTNRHSCNENYYTYGGETIPGIRINGMNVLAVKQGFAAVREHCSTGKGPIYVEFDTYRYHGHSMSDPGTTYRTREEVGGVRQVSLT